MSIRPVKMSGYSEKRRPEKMNQSFKRRYQGRDHFDGDSKVFYASLLNIKKSLKIDCIISIDDYL